MSSLSDDTPSTGTAVRGEPEVVVVDPAGDQSLTDQLTDIADGLLVALACRWVAVVVWASDGRAETAVTAGDHAAARAEIDGPQSPADLPGGVVTLPLGADTVPQLSAPLLLRGRAAGVVQTAGVADAVDLAAADSVVRAAAAEVGAVVERARTVEANRRRERWLSGGTHIARALTTANHPDPLAMIAEQAADVAGADVVLLFSPGALPGLFRVDASAGAAALITGQQVPDTDAGDLARVLGEGRSRRVVDLAVTTSGGELPIGAAVLAPMHGSTGLRGVICFGRSGSGTFSDAELGMATMFAGTVALALELAESQSRREQVTLILERDRIARDLHDHVIQRLYAIGLTMQHVSSSAGGETADRLVAAVTDIDAAIAQIRSTIFRLTTPILGAGVSLRARAEALVDELEPVLNFRASLVSEGPLEFGLDDELVTDCEAVLREGLTNVARHAGATRADVRVVVARDRVRIEITDDGRGVGTVDRRSGLGNLRRRAEQHGGSFELADAAPGTRLVWSVPLDS